MTHRPATRHTKPATQGGFSLVELMVSMVIGLVIVGAVFANYLTNKTGARQTEAMAQVTDDATTAFGILRSQIAMAGYSQPTGVSATTGEMVRADLGLAILGCEGGFDGDPNSRQGASTADNINESASADIRCATTTAGSANTPDALLVRYQADTNNTPKIGSDASDCQGTAIALPQAPAGVVVADNRFRIDKGSAELECSGNGRVDRTPSQSRSTDPLVQNIVDMQLSYGVAAATAPGVVNRYVRANEVAVAGAVGYEANWANVVAVRVCLVVRSTDAVLDAVTDYRDCNGTVTTPPDRRVYRAFTSTILLNNRSALPNLTATP
jgi:type IV pilus assembly protein PilW